MKYLLFILFFLSANNLLATPDKLSSEDIKRLQDRAIKYVGEFENFIKEIGETNSIDNKQTLIAAASYLFESKATIEVSNIKTSDKSPRPIKIYLSNLLKLSRKYGIITIKFSHVYVDDKEKLKEKTDENGNTYYEGYCSFKQCFCATQTDGMTLNNDIEKRPYTSCTYGDCTVKKVKIVVTKVTTVKGERWVLKLSNITIIETDEIK